MPLPDFYHCQPLPNATTSRKRFATKWSASLPLGRRRCPHPWYFSKRTTQPWALKCRAPRPWGLPRERVQWALKFRPGGLLKRTPPIGRPVGQRVGQTIGQTVGQTMGRTKCDARVEWPAETLFFWLERKSTKEQHDTSSAREVALMPAQLSLEPHHPSGAFSHEVLELSVVYDRWRI